MTMETAAPPQIDLAHQQIKEALQAVEKREVDTLQLPWNELEKSIIKLLGGPFQLERAEHQMVAVGIAGALGERLSAAHRAFWFLNRESPEGAGLGFPDA